MRDTADEEVVASVETFVTAAHGEPDLAEEVDRADEAAETEVDEEIPSPEQQRQLLRAHVNLGHPTIGEFRRALRSGLAEVLPKFAALECLDRSAEATEGSLNSAGFGFPSNG